MASLLVFAALVVAGLASAVAAGAALSWDGAYYLFKALDTQQPFLPLGRSVNVALQAPVLVASRLTSDMATLRAVFVIPYISLPAVGLGAAWWVCRQRRASLFVWPVLAICLATLPGQFFFTSEGPWVAAFFWPVLLAIALGPRRRELPLLAVLSAAIWAAHPIAALLFTLAAAVAGWMAWQRPSARLAALALAALFLALAAAKALAPLSGYETESLSLQRLRDSFRVAVVGWPLVSLACLGLATAVVAAQPWLIRDGARAWGGRLAGVAPAALALAAGLSLIPWARDYYQWAHALDYRFWVGILHLGFMALALREVVCPPAPKITAGLWPRRLPVVLASAAAFAVVLALQSRSWTQATDRLDLSLAATPPGCSAMADLGWLSGTPLNHWATASYAIVRQGRSPDRLILDGTGCQEWHETGGVRIAPWELRPAGGGWLHLPEP